MDLANAPLPQATRTDFHRPVFCLLGMAFDQVSMNEVLARLRDAVANRKRTVISTPNVNNIVAMQRDAVFRDAITRCELVVADGMPLVWLARLLGIHTTRIAGSDMFQHLMNGDAGPMRAFFFGGPEGVADQAVERLSRDAGPMEGAGAYYPGFGTLDEMSRPEVVARINHTAPDFIVVALGTAKGQRWIETNAPVLNAPILSHLGAVVNFVAGSVRRAPGWMQHGGLEWVWRILEEPKLWRRYYDDGKVLLALCASKVLPLALKRLQHGLRPLRGTAKAQWQAGTLTLTGDWRPADLPALRQALTTATAEDGPITIDATAIGWADQGVVALLIRLYGHQHKAGQAFRLSGNPAFERLLGWHCASYLLAPSAR